MMNREENPSNDRMCFSGSEMIASLLGEDKLAQVAKIPADRFS